MPLQPSRVEGNRAHKKKRQPPPATATCISFVLKLFGNYHNLEVSGYIGMQLSNSGVFA